MSSSGLCRQRESSLSAQLNESHPAHDRSFVASFLKYVMELLVKTMCVACVRIFRNRPVFQDSGRDAPFGSRKALESSCNNSNGMPALAGVI